MFLMRADRLRGQVGGGWAVEIESFLGPVKWHRANRRVPFWPQKTRNYYLLYFNSFDVGPYPGSAIFMTLDPGPWIWDLG